MVMRLREIQHRFQWLKLELADEVTASFGWRLGYTSVEQQQWERLRLKWGGMGTQGLGLIDATSRLNQEARSKGSFLEETAGKTKTQ